tara:strand:+ start:1077 stop:2180 length:1104 start_codon:yes stop_codon:yes gene_type:complete
MPSYSNESDEALAAYEDAVSSGTSTPGYSQPSRNTSRGRQGNPQGSSTYDRADSVTGQDIVDYARSQGLDVNSVEDVRKATGGSFQQSYIDEVAEWKGRRDAGLEGDRALAMAEQLKARAEGTAGPSFAEQELQKRIGTAARGQVGAAQRVGGRFAAGAARAGTQASDRLRAAGDTAVTALRQMEQQQAQQQYDQFMLSAEQGAANAALAREQMEFQRQQAEDAGNDALWSGILGALGAIGGGFLGMAGGPAGIIAGAGAGYQVGAGTGSAISDERLKTNVNPHEGMEGAYQFLDALDGARYDIPATREQGSYGVMAQSAERTPMGRSFVEQTPQGVRTLNPGKGFNALLLAQKSLHERLKRLEGGE